VKKMKNKAIECLLAIVILEVILLGCVEKETTSSTPTPTQVTPSQKNQHQPKTIESKPAEPTVTKKPEVKSVLIVIAPKDFRDEELFEPKKIFEEKGIRVNITSTTTDTARGMLGRTVKPDITISEAKLDEYEAIVVVGGRSAGISLGEPRVKNLSQKSS